MCLVEPIRPAGFTAAGIYAADSDRDMDHKTSMLCHVWAMHPDNVMKEALGEVCVVPVYSWDDLEYDGEMYHFMNESRILATIPGYFDEADKIADEVEADSYPVCGK